jgi:hypothetical protein
MKYNNGMFRHGPKMNWKNELVTSAVEAEDFLRRQLGNLIIPELHIECNRRRDFWFWAGIETKNDISQVLEMNINTSIQISWEYLNVGEEFRNKGLGLGMMAVKCALGLAHEHAADYIVLDDVRYDGPGFWPSLGAMPVREPFAIQGHIEHILGLRKKEITPVATNEIKEIEALAGYDTWAAWRALSQTSTGLEDGTFFKQEVFALMCTNEKLVLHLDDTETQSILRKRLGDIPDFSELETSRRNRRAFQRSQVVTPIIR